MDFYQAQEEARKKTKWLGFGFFLSVLAVMVAVGGLISVLYWKYMLIEGASFPLEVFGVAALGAAGTILVPFGYKSMQLSSGGDVVARDLGGRLLDGSPSDFHEKRLLNVVEEMALASGVPVPMVYVMDHENSINAFAAGTEPTNAVIGVTRGCLERLNREELQGVIAHEFSHILNGDMKMNMRMIGWVFGLMAISIIGQMLFRSLSYGRFHVGSRDREGNGNQLMLVLLALGVGFMVIGGIGVFFGRLLQSAISRQREYLADASAVQFTRNPETIAGALAKIGGFSEGSKIQAPKAAEASHMFFSDGGLFSFGFATHPPLHVRIKRIKKDWDGEFDTSNLPNIQHRDDSPISQFSSSEPSMQQAVEEPLDHDLSLPEEVLGIPAEFIQAAHNPDNAQLLVIAMLVATEGGLHGEEAAHLSKVAPDLQGLQLVSEWHQGLSNLHSLHKISLIDLAMPTLRRLSGPSKERFISITRELIEADREVSLFEYMLQRVVERHLLRHAQGASYSKVRHSRFEQVRSQAEVISNIMMRCHTDDFILQMNDIRNLDDALSVCEHCSPKVKNQLLDHSKELALDDGVLTNKEAELLRAIADAIGCTIPLGEILDA